MYKAIGMLELSSIGKGMFATDAMIKAADVAVVTAGSVCPGKYMVVLSGDVAAVQNAITVGERECGGAYIDDVVIPNVHEGIFPAITGTTMPQQLDALGVIESFFFGFYDSRSRYCLKGSCY